MKTKIAWKSLFGSLEDLKALALCFIVLSALVIPSVSRASALACTLAMGERAAWSVPFVAAALACAAAAAPTAGAACAAEFIGAATVAGGAIVLRYFHNLAAILRECDSWVLWANPGICAEGAAIAGILAPYIHDHEPTLWRDWGSRLNEIIRAYNSQNGCSGTFNELARAAGPSSGTQTALLPHAPRSEGTENGTSAFTHRPGGDDARF